MSRQQIQFPVQQVQTATPANPPAGTMRLYPKTDGKYYKLSPAGVEAELGGAIPDPLVIGTLRATSVQATDSYNLYSGGTVQPVITFGGETLFWSAGGGQYRWVNQGNSIQMMTLDTSSNLTITGTLQAGRVQGNSMQINGGSGISGRTTLSYTDGNGIAAAGGSLGALEIMTTSGASMIAFHRSGSFATYLGIDTDNVLRIGGWSLGAAAYKILDVRDYSVNYNSDTLVMRYSGGNIQCGGVYMPTGAQGGKPAYVIGQTGDGWMRWWPASAIGPPANAIGIGQAWGRSGDWNRVQVGAFQLDRVGYWVIIMVGRMNGGGGVAQYWLNIDGLGDVTYGDADSSGDSTMYATIGAIYYYNGLLGPNNWIRTLVANANNDVTGTTYAYFLATQAYPN